MQYINLHTTEGDLVRDALSYLFEHSLRNTHLLATNQNSFSDESKLEHYTYYIPQPYSEGADPDGKLNQEEYENFQKDVITELNKCLGLKNVMSQIKEDHFIVSTDKEESLVGHFNDHTLTLLYHYTGQW